MQQHTSNTARKIDRLRRGQFVQEAIAVKNTKFNELINTGEFPPPLKIGAGRATFWPESWVAEWIEAAKNGTVSEYMKQHLASRNDLKNIS